MEPVLTHQKASMSKSLDQALARLSEKAVALNTTVIAANELIERANRALSSMNLGIELWLSDVVLDHEGEGAVVLELGFDKVDGTWQLAVRWVSGDGPNRSSALEKQSREIRIRAAAHVQTVVEALTSRIDGMLGSTSAGTRQAKP